MKEAEKQNQLHLVLKSEWYDMIACGKKTTEYRDMTMQYSVKLKNFLQKNEVQHLVTEDGTFIGTTDSPIKEHPVFVCFHRGYTQKTISRRIIRIDFGTGVQEWGAEPGKFYYKIQFANQENNK